MSEIEKLLKECWEAGKKYGGNWTDKNFNDFMESHKEQVKLFDKPNVLPRYFIDERSGCAAVRDREHVKYNKDYPGLHQDTPDVVVYAHGFQNHEKGCWEKKDTDINYLKLECDRLNNTNNHDNTTKTTQQHN